MKDSIGNVRTRASTSNPVGNIEIPLLAGSRHPRPRQRVRRLRAVRTASARAVRRSRPLQPARPPLQLAGLRLGAATSGSRHATPASTSPKSLTRARSTSTALLGTEHDIRRRGRHQLRGQHGKPARRSAAQDFPNEFFKYLTSAATITTGTSDRADWGLVSYFGRLSYTWREKVTARFNVRRDGSSRFGANNRFGTFPSVSVNWRIGDESFLQGQNVLREPVAARQLRCHRQPAGSRQLTSRARCSSAAPTTWTSPAFRPSQLANADLQAGSRPSS